MEPHGQGPWYLHEILSFAKASEGYPLVAKSAEASSFWHKNDSATLTHSFTGRVRGPLRRRIKWGTVGLNPVFLPALPVEPAALSPWFLINALVGRHPSKGGDVGSKTT